MFGRVELEKLNRQKQLLLLESRLNRLQFRAELAEVRSAGTWWVDLARAPQKLSPLLLILAPVAGFLLGRGAKRPGPSRLLAVARLLPALYRLWRRYARWQREHRAAPGQTTG